MTQKILIVEDDQALALSLVVRLRAEGFDVHCAYDAVMATCAATKLQPDLVLLDISMPAGNGFDVADRLQSNVRTAGVPMVFLTASRRETFRDRAMAVGASAFLEKPFDGEELVRIVRDCLGVSTPS